MREKVLMRGEAYQNTVAVVFVALMFASVILIVNFPSAWILYAPALVAAALLPSLYLRESDLPPLPTSPSQILESLANRLQGTPVGVRRGRDSLSVRINGLIGVRVRVRVTDRGSVTSCQAELTTLGGSLIVALIVLAVTSIFAVAGTLYLFLRARRFARTRIADLLQTEAASLPTPPSDEIHAALVGSLTSARRMAWAAYDAQRNANLDAHVIGAMGVFTAWFAILIGLFVAINGFNLVSGRWEVPLAGATGGAIFLAVLTEWSIRRSIGPRLVRYRSWANRLDNALGRELARRVPETEEPSTFELLAEASLQASDWAEGQRRAGLSGDPRAGFLILLLTSLVASMVSNAIVTSLRSGLSDAWPYSVLAVAIAAVTFLYYRRWRRSRDARLAQSQAEWEIHTRALRERMDRFLQEL